MRGRGWYGSGETRILLPPVGFTVTGISFLLGATILEPNLNYLHYEESSI